MALHGLLTIFSQVGNTIFGNLAFIFAMVIALGMAKNEKAVAVLASGVSFFMCARHGTNLASESLATGIYRQV